LSSRSIASTVEHRRLGQTEAVHPLPHGRGGAGVHQPRLLGQVVGQEDRRQDPVRRPEAGPVVEGGPAAAQHRLAERHPVPQGGGERAGEDAAGGVGDIARHRDDDGDPAGHQPGGERRGVDPVGCRRRLAGRQDDERGRVARVAEYA
jgi:hypothetical protein